VFGINLLCLTGFVGADHLRRIEGLKALGYDGVEVPVLSGDPNHYAWLGDQLDRIGLRRATTSIVPSPDANPLSSDPEIRARGIAHLDWALDCAIALGADSVGGPFHAPIGHFTGQGPSEDELLWGAEAHRRMAERAAPHGVHLSLEPLNRFETHFLNTAEQAASYAERVGHPGFRIMHDTFHANIEERDPVAAIRRLQGRIGVVHISENDRGIPGTGHIDFGAVFAALRETGYDGWITVEAFGQGLPEIAAATRVWRPLFPDLDTLFSRSIAFLRAGWDAG
jgi:D-psicose/D-tagatose/L-ribulose 3-epimerase